MAEITTTSTESKNLQETILVDGKVAYGLNASLSDNRAGGFSVSGNPASQELYQANKEEIEPAIQDFVSNILNQAEAQESSSEGESDAAPAESVKAESGSEKIDVKES